MFAFHKISRHCRFDAHLVDRVDDEIKTFSEVFRQIVFGNEIFNFKYFALRIDLCNTFAQGGNFALPKSPVRACSWRLTFDSATLSKSIKVKRPMPVRAKASTAHEPTRPRRPRRRVPVKSASRQSLRRVWRCRRSVAKRSKRCRTWSNPARLRQIKSERKPAKMPDCTKAAYYTGKQSGCSAVV